MSPLSVLYGSLIGSVLGCGLFVLGFVLGRAGRTVKGKVDGPLRPHFTTPPPQPVPAPTAGLDKTPGPVQLPLKRPTGQAAGRFIMSPDKRNREERQEEERMGELLQDMEPDL